jgi:hypothetical protein
MTPYALGLLYMLVAKKNPTNIWFLLDRKLSTASIQILLILSEDNFVSLV